MGKLFDNVKFGDKFKMRNGNPALYIHSYMSGDTLTHYLVQEQFKASILQCYDDGQNCMNNKEWNEILFPDYVQYDIVGKWEEPIDEKKLNKIATEAVSEFKGSGLDWSTGENYLTYEDKIKLYKKGYRKAKEN